MATEGSTATAAERILIEAERLFGDAGYEGVSVNAVARAAGVSKANVFHHFGSKEELYLAVLERARGRLTAQVGQLATRADAPLDEILGQFAGGYLADLFAHGDLVRLFMRELLDRGPVAEKVLAERIFEPNFSRLRELFEQARGDGRIREEVEPAVAISLLAAGCVFFFQSREVLRHLPGGAFAEDPEAYTRTIVDIVMHGISPR